MILQSLEFSVPMLTKETNEENKIVDVKIKKLHDRINTA